MLSQADAVCLTTATNRTKIQDSSELLKTVLVAEEKAGKSETKAANAESELAEARSQLRDLEAQAQEIVIAKGLEVPEGMGGDDCKQQ